MNTIDASTVLPISMLVQSTGTFTLTADALNTPGLTAYLKDATTGTTTDLSAGPISIALTAGVASNRYSVVFAASTATGIKDIEQPVNIYSNDNTIYVNRASNGTATIVVYNLVGQQIAETTTTSEKSTLTITNQATEYAIVKVTEGSKVSVAKVLINNKN